MSMIKTGTPLAVLLWSGLAAAAAVLEPITADLDVFENGSYHDLLLMYRGEIGPGELWGGQEDAPPARNAGGIRSIGMPAFTTR